MTPQHLHLIRARLSVCQILPVCLVHFISICTPSDVLEINSFHIVQSTGFCEGH